MLNSLKLAKIKCKLRQLIKDCKRNQATKVTAMIQRSIKMQEWSSSIQKNRQNKIHNLLRTINKNILNLSQKFNLMMMIQILNCLIINHTELKVQNINMLSHQLHKFITADQLLELSNQYLIISKMITVRANQKVRRTCKSQKTILLQERTCIIKMITKRDTYPKAFKVAIQMIKVNKLDINHFHNTKTLKK